MLSGQTAGTGGLGGAVDEQSLASFEQWAVEHGSADVTALDRRKVALDLFALGGEALEESHIDALAAQYKAGLQGAHRILAVRKVGAELLEWRKSQARSPDRHRAQTARSATQSTAPSGGAKSVRPGRVSLQWARAIEPASDGAEPGASSKRELERAETVLEPREATIRPASSAPAPARRSTSSSQKLQALAAPGSSALAAPNLPSLEVEQVEGVAPRARRADLELGFAEHGIAVDPSDAFDEEIPARVPGARSSTLPSERPRAGVASVPPNHARSASERAPARARAASPLPFIAPRAAGTPLPFAAVGRSAPSEAPPEVGASRAGHGSSIPPARSPSTSPGSASEPPERAPSSRPPRVSPSRNPPSLSPSSSLRPSVRVPDSVSLFPTSPPEPEEGASRRWPFVALGAVVLLALALGFASGLFDRRRGAAEPVLGTFPSEHLGLSFRPAGLWLHAADRDERTKLADGWERRSSLLYRGASADAFDAQLYVSVFAHPGRVATPEDARRLGGAELAEANGPRECGEHQAGALSVYGCNASLRGPKGVVPCFEAYVQWGARVLFVRHAAEPMGVDGPGPELEALTVFSTIAPFR